MNQFESRIVFNEYLLVCVPKCGGGGGEFANLVTLTGHQLPPAPPDGDYEVKFYMKFVGDCANNINSRIRWRNSPRHAKCGGPHPVGSRFSGATDLLLRLSLPIPTRTPTKRLFRHSGDICVKFTCLLSHNRELPARPDAMLINWSIRVRM